MKKKYKIEVAYGKAEKKNFFFSPTDGVVIVLEDFQNMEKYQDMKCMKTDNRVKQKSSSYIPGSITTLFQQDLLLLTLK